MYGISQHAYDLYCGSHNVIFTIQFLFYDHCSVRFEWRFVFPDPDWGYMYVAGGGNASAKLKVGSPSTAPNPEMTAMKSEWDLRFQELVAFKEQYDSYNVPEETGEFYRWVQNQRKLCRQKEAGSLNCDSDVTQARYWKLKSLDGFLGQRKRKANW